MPESADNLGVCNSDTIEVCPCCYIDGSLTEDGEVLTCGIEGDVTGC